MINKTQNTLKTSPGNYLLNAVELNKILPDTYFMYEIEIPEWDKKKDYGALSELKSLFNDPYFLFEQHGRYIILILNNKPSNINEILDAALRKIKESLLKIVQKEVSFTLIEKPLEKINCDENIGNIVRKGIGEVISVLLHKLGFNKVGSGGGIGIFALPQNWMGEAQSYGDGSVNMFRAMDLSVILSESGTTYYLSADVKGHYDEQISLSNWMEKLKINKPINEWYKSNRLWKIKLDNPTSKLFGKDLEDEVFELQEIQSWSKIKEMEIGYGKYSNKSWAALLDQKIISPDIQALPFVITKAKGKVVKDPNKNIALPKNLFYRVLSKPIDRSTEKEFKRFTQLTPQKRNLYISAFFQKLYENRLSKNKVTFSNYPITFAAVGVGEYKTSNYGRAPPFHELGFEKWGMLATIPIFYYKYPRLEKSVQNFRQILLEQLELCRKETSKRLGQKIPEVKITLNPIQNVHFINDSVLGPMNSSFCPIIFKSNKFGNYREIKTKFTQEKGIPVQVIEEETLINNPKLVGLVRTLIPQIIAKTGGFPFKLSSNLLDKSIIIGLDKARDSSMQRPSASAGIASVTPDGQYISGASTPLELNSTDFIDVDQLAPTLLRELEEKKINKQYDFVVILRDGAPNICRREVPLWKKHLENYNKSFIFLASRKTNPYRVFPSDIGERTQNRRVDYSIPAVLNGPPLPENEFLLLAAKAAMGTPKPMLYTMMENTTSLNLTEVKEKVLSQVLSMSMLCWEAPLPTSQPLPLHYADKLAGFTQMVQQAWNSSNRYPMFI